MIEVWKSVLQEFYEVSNLGNVRSRDRVGADGRRWMGKPIKLCPNARYLYFNASVNGEKSKARVHVLVADQFIGPRPVRMEINHKDGDLKNNVYLNLEYATRKKNAEHAARKGLMPTKANGRWKRTWRP